MSEILDAKVSAPHRGGPSFSLANRLERALWTVVWSGFGAWTPTPLFRWRRFLLQIFGARLAPTARVYPRVRVWLPRNLAMGPFATLGPRVDCYCMAKITLGDKAVVSQDAVLCAGTHDIDDPIFQLRAIPIHLGDQSWIAAGAFVGPGVIVHEGAVLGARAVTTKSVAPWTVSAGNPARVLRQRRRPQDLPCPRSPLSY